MRNRVQVTIGTRRMTPVRRGVSTETESYAPELSMTVGCTNLIDGLNRAIRLLTSERDALMETGKAVQPVLEDEDDDEEEDED